VRQRWHQWFVIGLVGICLGLQWTLLQSVAWTVMLFDRGSEMGWERAFATTFDGRHPCALCRVVRAGREAEDQQTRTFGIPLVKTDMVQAEPSFALPAPLPGAMVVLRATDEHADRRAGEPPHQPPRLA
jgi:hypothetical protein